MTEAFLCLDYGTKRLGVALATTPLAEPLQIIVNDDKTVGAISKLCDDHHVTDIVFGVSEGAMGNQSKEFAQKIKRATGLPIHFQNETLSSFEVHENLLAIGTKKTKTKQPIDHYAAAAILQDYLDENKPFN